MTVLQKTKFIPNRELNRGLWLPTKTSLHSRKSVDNGKVGSRRTGMHSEGVTAYESLGVINHSGVSINLSISSPIMNRRVENSS